MSTAAAPDISHIGQIAINIQDIDRAIDFYQNKLGLALSPSQTTTRNDTFHHIGRSYMQQYLNEFDFRYNNRKITDSERTLLALEAIEAKRLTLKQPKSASA